MNQISQKTLDRYFQIYEQIYEDPFIPLYQITKNTKVSRSTVFRYVKEMYKLSILQITPLLRKIGVRYDIYRQWREELNNHCTIHTGFYPEGYREYMAYQFLFCTDCKPLLKSVFSQFPTTPVLTEMGDHLSVCVNIPFSDASKHLFCIIHNMRIQGVITEFSQAAALFYNQCKELHSDEHGAEP